MKYREITEARATVVTKIIAYGCPNCDFQAQHSWDITPHVLSNHLPTGVVYEKVDDDDWYFLTQESDAKFFKNYAIVEAYDWDGAGWYMRIERPDDGPHADTGDTLMTFVAASKLLKEVDAELETLLLRRLIIDNYTTGK